jgi:metal-responsive CopG/Arc/MetJ family transcriptional regulator
VPGKRVSIHLSQELLDRLDERAAKEGRSRAALIADAIEAFAPDETLRAEERARISREIVEGYERIPQVEAEPW